MNSLQTLPPQVLIPGTAAHAVGSVMAMMLFVIILIMMVYALRHAVFTLRRLFRRQRHPYLDIDTAQWPMVTVFIAAHNEELVIGGCLRALLNSNYPAELQLPR